MAVISDDFVNGGVTLEFSEMDEATLLHWTGISREAQGEYIRRFVPTKRYNPDQHLASRFNKYHDPHSGKFASHGGSGGYVPGQWKTGTREDAVDVATEQMFQTLWSRRGDADAHAEFGEDMFHDEDRVRNVARQAAERSLGKTAWALTNGPHRITGTNGKPDLKLAEHVDDLQARFPAQGSIHIHSDNTLPSWVNGETDLATGHIRLQRSLGNRKGFPGEEPDWAIPMAGKVSNREYILTHEWGHRLEADAMKSKQGGPDHIVYKLFDVRIAARKAGGLSTYGDSDDHEGFAESFAEWALSRGRTTNPAARVYAETFGWEAR